MGRYKKGIERIKDKENILPASFPHLYIFFSNLLYTFIKAL
jgi:hypothetical protein